MVLHRAGNQSKHAEKSTLGKAKAEREKTENIFQSPINPEPAGPFPRKELVASEAHRVSAHPLIGQSLDLGSTESRTPPGGIPTGAAPQRPLHSERSWRWW